MGKKRRRRSKKPNNVQFSNSLLPARTPEDVPEKMPEKVALPVKRDPDAPNCPSNALQECKRENDGYHSDASTVPEAMNKDEGSFEGSFLHSDLPVPNTSASGKVKTWLSHPQQGHIKSEPVSNSQSIAENEMGEFDVNVNKPFNVSPENVSQCSDHIKAIKQEPTEDVEMTFSVCEATDTDAIDNVRTARNCLNDETVNAEGVKDCANSCPVPVTNSIPANQTYKVLLQIREKVKLLRMKNKSIELGSTLPKSAITNTAVADNELCPSTIAHVGNLCNSLNVPNSVAEIRCEEQGTLFQMHSPTEQPIFTGIIIKTEPVDKELSSGNEIPPTEKNEEQQMDTSTEQPLQNIKREPIDKELSLEAPSNELEKSIAESESSGCVLVKAPNSVEANAVSSTLRNEKETLFHIRIKQEPVDEERVQKKGCNVENCVGEANVHTESFTSHCAINFSGNLSGNKRPLQENSPELETTKKCRKVSEFMSTNSNQEMEVSEEPLPSTPVNTTLLDNSQNSAPKKKSSIDPEVEARLNILRAEYTEEQMIKREPLENSTNVGQITDIVENQPVVLNVPFETNSLDNSINSASETNYVSSKKSGENISPKEVLVEVNEENPVDVDKIGSLENVRECDPIPSSSIESIGGSTDEATSTIPKDTISVSNIPLSKIEKNTSPTKISKELKADKARTAEQHNDKKFSMDLLIRFWTLNVKIHPDDLQEFLVYQEKYKIQKDRFAFFYKEKIGTNKPSLPSDCHTSFQNIHHFSDNNIKKIVEIKSEEIIASEKACSIPETSNHTPRSEISVTVSNDLLETISNDLPRTSIPEKTSVPSTELQQTPHSKDADSISKEELLGIIVAVNIPSIQDQQSVQNGPSESLGNATSSGTGMTPLLYNPPCVSNSIEKRRNSFEHTETGKKRKISPADYQSRLSTQKSQNRRVVTELDSHSFVGESQLRIPSTGPAYNSPPHTEILREIGDFLNNYRNGNTIQPQTSVIEKSNLISSPSHTLPVEASQRHPQLPAVISNNTYNYQCRNVTNANAMPGYATHTSGVEALQMHQQLPAVISNKTFNYQCRNVNMMPAYVAVAATNLPLLAHATATNIQLPAQATATNIQLPAQAMATNIQLPAQAMATNIQLPAQAMATNIQLPAQAMATNIQLPAQAMATNITAHAAVVRDPRLPPTKNIPSFPGRKGNEYFLNMYNYRNIGKGFITNETFASLVLQWNPNWINIQKQSRVLAPICETYVPVKYTYNNELEYYNTYVSLLLLDTWLKMADSFDSPDKNVYAANFIEQKSESDHINVCCTVVLREIDMCPKRDDILLCRVRNINGNLQQIFGHVSTVLSKKCDPPRNEIGNWSKLKINFYCVEQLGPGKMEIKILYNIRIACLQNSALHNLNDNIKYIAIDPKLQRNCIEFLPYEHMASEKAMRDRIIQSLSRIGIRAVMVDISQPFDYVPLISLLAYALQKKGAQVVVCVKTDEVFRRLGKRLMAYDPVFAVRSKEIQHLIDEEFDKRTIDRLLETKGKITDIYSKCPITLTMYSALNLRDDKQVLSKKGVTCILGEAHICTEPETILPLMYSVKKMILVGGSVGEPIVASSLRQYGYNLSFYRRLFRSK